MWYWLYVSWMAVISAAIPLAVPFDVWEINTDIRLDAQQPIKPDVFLSKTTAWTERKVYIYIYFTDKWRDRGNQ